MHRTIDRDKPYSSELISERSTVIALLRRIKKQRALLTVSTPGIQELYSSAVLEIDVNRGHFVIDELTPSVGQRRLQAFHQIAISARLEGIETRFDAALIRIETINGVASNYMALPKFIDYQQKRRHFRVQVPRGLNLSVAISFDDRQMILEGKIQDISLGGIAAIFRTERAFPKGAVVDSCNIALPDGTVISSPLKIRSVRPNKNRKELILGGAFLGLIPKHKRALEHFVRQLERESIRKQM
jgi:c-di-GMP-binding flagellar brake protein YcgR